MQKDDESMVNEFDEPLPVSGLYEIMQQASGLPSGQYSSWAEALADPSATVVLSGDWGGTVLLTAPLRFMECDMPTLRALAVDLDALLWSDPEGIELMFLHLPVGSRVPGGMGGGKVIDGVWIHPRFGDEALTAAEDVLAGRRDRLAIQD